MLCTVLTASVLMHRNNPLLPEWELRTESVDRRRYDLRADELLHRVEQIWAGEELVHGLAGVVAALDGGEDLGSLLVDLGGACEKAGVWVGVGELALRRQLCCLGVDHRVYLALEGVYVRRRDDVLREHPPLRLKVLQVRGRERHSAAGVRDAAALSGVGGCPLEPSRRDSAPCT